MRPGKIQALPVYIASCKNRVGSPVFFCFFLWGGGGRDKTRVNCQGK